jgi:DNA-3-methyladenine glycosylase
MMTRIPRATGAVVAREPLRRAFYLRPTEEVARDLLGRLLVKRERGHRLAIRIVEVEAYLGIDDAACHTFGGRRTPRVEPMWGAGGHAYVYFTYGMHHCVNVVTREAGVPEAVLVRAGEPVEGADVMASRRPRTTPRERLTSGPACLAAALGLDRHHSGLDLVTGERLWIEPGTPVPEAEIERSGRVGVGYAGDASAWPLRFFVRGSRAVSVVRRALGQLRITETGSSSSR